MSPVESIERATSFLILGAMKCGTTSLYRHLDEHPDVAFSEPKEPVFFESLWVPGAAGLALYRERFFGHWRGEAAVGEARTHNLGLPFVPARVHETLPEARLIAVLRDPVDRAYSEWWHLLSRGSVAHSFEEGIEENLARHARGQRFEGEAGARAWREGLLDPTRPTTRYGLYLDLGYYAEQIERYRALFAEERIKVVFFEDLSRDPLAVCRDLWSFLGVDPDRPLDDTDARNPARDRVRSPRAARWGDRVARMPGKEWIKRWVPEALLDLWRRFVDGRPARRPAMKAETERFLLDHFAPHNRALEALTGRALPGWFEPSPRRTAAAGRASEAEDDEIGPAPG